MTLDGVEAEATEQLASLTTTKEGLVGRETNIEFFAVGCHLFHLFVCVVGKAVERHHHRLPHVAQVLHMACHVVEARLCQSTCRYDQDRERGVDVGLTAFDIEKLFCAEISAKARLRHHIVAVTHCHLRCQHTVASVGDVGEGSTVDKCRRVLRGLHQVRLECIHQHYHHSPHAPQVSHIERFALAGDAQQDVLYAASQVIDVVSETEDSHDFRCRSDVETAFTHHAVAVAQSGDDGAQGTVVHVEDATPEDGLQLAGLTLMAEDVIIYQCGDEVVGGGDSVEVASEMEIDFLHRQHL